jgi:hypothetical protein
MPKYNYKKAWNGKNAKRGRAKAASAFKRIATSAAKSAARSARREATAASKQLTIDMLAGSGDYRIKQKKYVTGRHGFDKVGRHSSGGSSTGRGSSRSDVGKGYMGIKHTEYIGDLIASGSQFESQSYGINPGDSGTFPWLSSIAINFQHYKFRKLVFEYRPLVSEGTTAATNTLLSMGAVILGTQYDSVVGPYPNKATMAEADFSVTAKPSEHILHAIECEPKYNPLGILFVSGNQAVTDSGIPNADIRMQNIGIFQIANQGIPFPADHDGETTDLGEIWVHYEVDLFKPQLNAGLTNLLSCHYNSVGSGVGNPGPYAPFGGNADTGIQPIASAGSLLQLGFTSDTFTFPLSVTTGNFLCVYSCEAEQTGFDYQDAGPILTTNCDVLKVFNTTPEYDVPGVAPDAAYFAAGPQQVHVEGGDHPAVWMQMVFAFVISVNAPGAELASVGLNFPGETEPGRCWELFVTPFNANIAT